MDSERPGFDFLAGGGEMGALMRAFDWNRSSLGSPERESDPFWNAATGDLDRFCHSLAGRGYARSAAIHGQSVRRSRSASIAARAAGMFVKLRMSAGSIWSSMLQEERGAGPSPAAAARAASAKSVS